MPKAKPKTPKATATTPTPEPVQIVRQATMDVAADVVTVSVSSETPVLVCRHWNGRYQPVMEILDHTPGSIDTTYIRDGLTIRDGHGGDIAGIVRPVQIADGKLCGPIEWSASERAAVLRADSIARIRRSVSVEALSTWPDNVKQEGSTDDGKPIIRVMRWTPTAAAIISGEPADPTVGVFRELEHTDPETTQQAAEVAATEKETHTMPENDNTTIIQRTRVDEIRELREFAKEIGATDEVLREAIREKWSIERFADAAIASKGTAKPLNQNASPNLDLSDKEVKRYSVLSAIDSLITGRTDTFEREVSAEIARQLGKAPAGLYIPDKVLISRVVSSGGTGASLISTDLLTGSFVDLLRAKMVATALGVQVVGGLRGDIDIPKQTSGSTGYWVARDGSATESTPAFTQIRATPHTVGGRVLVGRSMLKQSSMDAEALITNDITMQLRVALDSALINGTGANGQPKGLLLADDLNAGTITTPGTVTWANINTFWSVIEADLVDASTSKWLMHPTVAGYFAGTFVNTGTAVPFLTMGPTPTMCGFPAVISTQLATDLLLFGVWQNLSLLLWGALDINLDTSSASASGSVYVTGLMDADVIVKRGQAFAYNGNVLA